MLSVVMLSVIAPMQGRCVIQTDHSKPDPSRPNDTISSPSTKNLHREGTKLGCLCPSRWGNVKTGLVVRKHFGTLRVFYSSSVYDMTHPQPKYHVSFVPENVTKDDEILYGILCKTHHRNILRVVQCCIALLFVADKE
jgi:hypothetical protein